MNFTDVFYLVVENDRIEKAIQIQAEWLGYQWLNRNRPQRRNYNDVLLFNYEKLYSMRYIDRDQLPSVQGSMSLNDFFGLTQSISLLLNKSTVVDVTPKGVFVRDQFIKFQQIEELYEKVQRYGK